MVHQVINNKCKLLNYSITEDRRKDHAQGFSSKAIMRLWANIVSPRKTNSSFQQWHKSENIVLKFVSKKHTNGDNEVSIHTQSNYHI